MVFVRRASVAAAWLTEYELPKQRMNDTFLAAAHNVTRVMPWRYGAWWEMARVYMERKEYDKAYPAFLQYLGRVPENKREKTAEIYYRILSRNSVRLAPR